MTSPDVDGGQPDTGADPEPHQQNRQQDRRHYTLYHRIAGGNLERLAALSDGIFAVTMTLLVLDLRRAAERRIIIAQSLYVVGVLLSIINTYVGIGFIVLLQLNSAIAPKIRPLDRF